MPAKHQSAAAGKAKPPAKAKRAQNLTSNAEISTSHGGSKSNSIPNRP